MDNREITEGMTPEQIADIISDRLIAIVKQSFADTERLMKLSIGKIKPQPWSPADAMRETDKIIKDIDSTKDSDDTTNFSRFRREGNTWTDWIPNTIVDMRNEEDESWKSQIIAFRNKGLGNIWKRCSDGKTFSSFTVSRSLYDVSEFLDTDRYEIYTVKSDSGIEWSIGDEYRDGRITHFTVDSKGQLNAHGIIGERFTFSAVVDGMEKPTPKKQVLFVTEDGVEIVIGMQCWYVNPRLCVIKEFTAHDNEHYEDAKYFSSKEKAEEYIRNNKPSISYAQLREFCKGNTEAQYIHVAALFNHFKPQP